MDEHIYVDLPTITPNGDCKIDPNETEGYTGLQERPSIRGQSLPDTPIETHSIYFTLEPEPGKSQLHKPQPKNDGNQLRALAETTEYTEPSVAVDCKKPNHLVIEPSVKADIDINPVKETLCTHLSTIRDKWWLFLLTAVFIGGILIGLIVFAALKSKDTSQQDGVSQCSWSSWSLWTGCYLLSSVGKQQRVKLYMGDNCKQNETREYRNCQDGVSQCSWSSWSLWTECYLLSSVGKQQRVKLYMGDNCKQNETREYRNCQDKIRQLDITFDRSTLFSTCFLSDDNTLLSNHYTDETQNGPDGNNQLKNYSGVVADTCVDDNTIIYFEIGYFYNINTLFDAATLVFEIGIAERQMIDNAPYVGDSAVKGWSFHLANCAVYNKICLSAQHSPEDEIIRPISSNTAGTTMHGAFGVLINRERDEFSLISNNMVVGMFTAVTSNVTLCPVFGIYNAHKMVGALKIMNARNYSNFVQSQWL